MKTQDKSSSEIKAFVQALRACMLRQTPTAQIVIWLQPLAMLI
jgi:hypothetical protein